jgi:hypothetical protein
MPSFQEWVVVVVIVVVLTVVCCLISCGEILDGLLPRLLFLDALLSMPEIFEAGDDDGGLGSESGVASSALYSSGGDELRELYLEIIGAVALRSRGICTALLGETAAVSTLCMSHWP